MRDVLLSADQLGILIKSARRQRGLTQAQLARRIGVSQPRLSTMESDPDSLTISQVLYLCAQLGLEISIRDKLAATEQVEGSIQSVAAPDLEW